MADSKIVIALPAQKQDEPKRLDPPSPEFERLLWAEFDARVARTKDDPTHPTFDR